MRLYLQKKVNEFTYYLELIISVILSVVILIMIFQLVITFVPGFIRGENSDVDIFLGKIMTLAIGVEFIKMLCKHTPSTVIEVLLFATSRQMVVEHPSTVETLIGVVALAGLFATRKFLLWRFDEVEKTVYRGSQSVKTVNSVAGIGIPSGDGETLSEVMEKKLKEKEKEPRIGAIVEYDTFVLRVDNMKDGKVTRVEVTKSS